MRRKFYTTNQYIRADSVRVVDEQAKQLGVMTKDEALKLATEEGKDLVLVAPSANPPVVKIINFAKFKYQEQQKQAASKKSAKGVNIKEIRLTPFIAQNDFNSRIKKAREFLTEGNKVRINVKFTGRQITHKEFGNRIMDDALDELSDLSTVEREPQLVGKILIAQLQPK